MYQSDDSRGQLKSRIKEGLPTMQPFPTSRYRLIVADPPWMFSLRESDASHRGRTPYPNMIDSDILGMPIAQIADPDQCYLLLWTTNAHLPLALSCLYAWGFQFKQIHHWIKVTKKDSAESDGLSLRWGLGHWGRNCTESFLVGTKGKEIKSFSFLGLTDVPNVIYETTGPHSKKPATFWNFADRLKSALGDPAAIELFSRESRAGWSAWGLESEPNQQHDNNHNP